MRKFSEGFSSVGDGPRNRISACEMSGPRRRDHPPAPAQDEGADRDPGGLTSEGSAEGRKGSIRAGEQGSGGNHPRDRARHRLDRIGLPRLMAKGVHQGRRNGRHLPRPARHRSDPPGHRRRHGSRDRSDHRPQHEGGREHPRRPLHAPRSRTERSGHPKARRENDFSQPNAQLPGRSCLKSGKNALKSMVAEEGL